jgi:aspartate-semialdehyde dehydrogenase
MEVSYGDTVLKCQDLAQFDFSKVDFALMSAGSAVSKEWGPKIAAAGALVIDNASHFRYDSDVPLIVPEVNAHVLDGYMAKNDRRNIIANPNCSTAQMVVALKPLHDRRRSSAWSSRPTSPCPAPARRAWTSCGTRPRACTMSGKAAGEVHQGRSPST